MRSARKRTGEFGGVAGCDDAAQADGEQGDALLLRRVRILKRPVQEPRADLHEDGRREPPKELPGTEGDEQARQAALGGEPARLLAPWDALRDVPRKGREQCCGDDRFSDAIATNDGVAIAPVPARLTFLKPLSAAIAIGTGGPFGAEGPIIATGGAIGSLIGQIIPTSISERKTLLAAGAAAGMAATFGSPVSAVLLAVELLLFEYRPQSLVPVALAASTAAAVRIVFEGAYPVFQMPDLQQPQGLAMVGYVLVGAVVGLLSVLVTKTVYWIEDAFECLPVHWMWWPALGAIAVGLCGYFAQRTLGVGYANITDTISAHFALKFVLWLVVMKFISWAIALGSGTSGGTLAPLFTIGSGCGFILGAALNHLLPAMGVDSRVAVLVGMAAMFAGASRALLASTVFAFETTRQPLGLLPLLGGCSAAYLIGSLLMRNTIMTEKIARRGIRVPEEYAADFLDQMLVRDVASKNVVALRGEQTLEKVRMDIASGRLGMTHQGFPVLDRNDHLIGVLTRRCLLDSQYPACMPVSDLIQRPPVVIYGDCSLREATDHMVRHGIGRLPVLDRGTQRLTGFITRSDLLGRIECVWMPCWLPDAWLIILHA